MQQMLFFLLPIIPTWEQFDSEIGLHLPLYLTVHFVDQILNFKKLVIIKEARLTEIRFLKNGNRNEPENHYYLSPFGNMSRV